MSDLLDWAEKNGLENLKGHHEVADAIHRQAVTTLTVLLAGATGGLAYAIKGVEIWSLWWATGSAAFALYLYALCALLICKVLTVRDFPALRNEPLNLYQPTYSLAQIKEVELTNIAERINRAVEQNIVTSKWLNRIRYAAVCSPLAFVVTAWVTAWVHPFELAEAAELVAAALQHKGR